MRALAAASRALDAVNEHVGRWTWWLAVILVLVQFAVVVLRYAFGSSFIMMQESVLYVHATLFMLGAGYTFLYNGHVRVDVFYGEWTPRTRAWVDLTGALLAVIPFCLLVIWVSSPFVGASWRILEGPLFVGGIPAQYLLKTLIPAFAALLMLQGASVALKAILVLSGRDLALFAQPSDKTAA